MLWVYMERGRGRKDKMRAQKIFSTQNTTWKIVYQGVYTSPLPGFLPAYRPHPK